MTTRRNILHAGLALGSAATLPTFTTLARAQALPFEQVKVFYGFPAGSAGDITARRVAEKMAGSGFTRNPAVVENKPGAGGRLALDALKGTAPDGQHILMSPYSMLAIYPHIYKKLSYERSDFVPISISAVMHHGLAVGPLVPASVKSVKDFVAWAKANPSQANYGSPGAGSTPHFLGALLGLNSGVEMKHVPYRGSVPGVTDVVGGQIAAMVTPHGDFLQHHRAGKLRLLATSGPQRNPHSSDVATFAEQGFPELTTEEWFGFFALARTPAPVIAAANAAINAALRDPSVVEGLGVVGLIARGSTPEAQGMSLQAEFDRWGPLVKRIGFSAES